MTDDIIPVVMGLLDVYKPKGVAIWLAAHQPEFGGLSALEMIGGGPRRSGVGRRGTAESGSVVTVLATAARPTNAALIAECAELGEA